ncbi:MAG TPA: 5-methyltetrahydropteroyltriglutamate--homocysteine S-methyltransferase [Xanthobacteraceae bacterium]|nr:5-methyltetrahydropteroyltriglutamate--homocysteine S-methyltransferase [Xanthobacteraceae bacterium]
MNVRTRVASNTMASKPPFRAEHIGSLLRPPELMRKRVLFARGEISQIELTIAEDEAICGVIEMQEQSGFKFVTDGEFRRRSYHSFFYGELGNLRIDTIGGVNAVGANGEGGRGAQPMAIIDSRVQWTHPIHAGDVTFLKTHSDRWPKITVPGPCALHFRGGDTAATASAYTDVEQFWSDIVEAFTRELHSLAEVGCRYVQIDETAFAKFGDPDVRASLAARGDDWSALIDKYIAVTNQVLAAAPKEMYIGMHLCRGNRGGHWHADGSYEEVADRLFNALAIPFYFLEYDTPRAGSFTPLRFVPKHKMVVLGLVSTKILELEDKGVLKRRLDDATKFVSLDRLAISPQCGFASVDTGNPVTAETQNRKLELVCEFAREIWGET